jgi:hypothetical protein
MYIRFASSANVWELAFTDISSIKIAIVQIEIEVVLKFYLIEATGVQGDIKVPQSFWTGSLTGVRQLIDV